MLAQDSLVIDLTFERGAQIEQDALIDALGGEEEIAELKLLDMDMLDPRLEMEISPSMPFRRRGERRLLIIDDRVAPMRENPRADAVIPVDIRPAREKLLALCQAFDIRLGRVFALGTLGDAVVIARTAVDLRGIALLAWIFDPMVDVDGKRRGTQLSPAEFEAKIMAYPKRLEERSEAQILADMAGGTLERHGDLLVVDVLEDDGTWDLRRSVALERSLAAVDTFSMIPGAPSRGKRSPDRSSSGARKAGGAGNPGASAAGAAAKAAEGAGKSAAPASPPPPEHPLGLGQLDGRAVLVFSQQRFDLDVAAQLGKRDYSAVIHPADGIPGPVRDQIYRDGADFIAPIEFLSEVFVDGKPLSRPQFDQGATTHDQGVRAMDVHCPRFGPVQLLDVPDRGRFISSAKSAAPAAIIALLSLLPGLDDPGATR